MKRQTQEARLSPDDLTHKVSRWQRYLYSTEREQNAGLQDSEQAGLTRNERFPDFQREAFAKLYSTSIKQLDEPATGSEWAGKLHGLMEEMPEFKILQERCRGDAVWSGMGTASLATSLTAKMEPSKSEHQIEELEKRLAGLQQMKQNGVPVDKQLQQAERALAQAKQEAADMADGLDPVQLRQAIRKGCEQAQQHINETERECSAYTYGTEPGVPAPRTDADAKRALAKRIRDNPKLKRIAQLAGRLRRVAAEKQRSKASDARSEVNNIEQGADPERLLPNEMVDLLDSEREAVFFARFLERRCLQYQLAGKEREGRGPIILACDESGSMDGDPECWAKAVSMALLDIAQRQRRTWQFVHFDSEVSRVDTMKAGTPDPAKLMDCMSWFTGGGTSFQAPLDAAVQGIRDDGALKKADVVLVTDGVAPVDAAWLQRFKQAKAELGFTVYAVLINLSGSSAAAVKQVADKVFLMSDMLAGKGGKFEDAVFTI